MSRQNHCVTTHKAVDKCQSKVVERPSQAAATSCSVARLLVEDNCDETDRLCLLFELQTYVTDYLRNLMPHSVGRDSSVGIATRYGLYGLGSNPGGGEIFRPPSRPALGAHPASYTVGTGSFPGVKRPGRGVYHPLPA